MKEVELSLKEIFALHSRINGDESNGGLLDSDLSMIERFWLNDLNDQLKRICGGVRNLRDDMIRRRGKPDSEGNVLIKATEEAELLIEGKTRKILTYTKEFLAFQKEYEELLEEVVRIDINEKISGIIQKLLKQD
jgi:hypothetical protein